MTHTIIVNKAPRHVSVERNYSKETSNQLIFLASFIIISTITNSMNVSLGGLWVTCSPRNPRFAGSNPPKVDGFFQDVKILSTSPPGGVLSWRSRV